MSRKNKKLIILIILTALTGVIMISVAPEEILDTRGYFTDLEAFTWLSSLNQQDLASYRLFLYLDFAYILFYSSAAYLFLGKKGLVPGILDMMENLSILFWIIFGTQLPMYLGAVSALKWLSGFCLVMMVIKKLKTIYLTRK